MKKIILLFAFATVLFHNPLVGQSLPLGIIDGKPVYWDHTLSRKKITFSITPYNPETLLPEATKKIVIPAPTPSAPFFSDHAFFAYYMDHKYYFFYCLYYGSPRNFVTVCNDDFTSSKTILLGVSSWYYATKFIASISPDQKTGLIYNKNSCGLEKNTGQSSSACTDHELLLFDFSKDTVRGAKVLSNKLNGFFLKVDQFKLDNNDNIACIASIKDSVDAANAITATSTAILKKADKALNISEVKIGNTKQISSYLTRLKNSDLAYFGVLDSKVIFRLITFDNPKNNLETSFSTRSFINEANDTSRIFNVSESETGYFLSLVNKRENYSVAFVNKKGELLWTRLVPSIQTVYKNMYHPEFKTSAFMFNNKLHLLFIENKPYEETNKVMKALKHSEFITELDNKKLNTTLVSIDEIGKMKKEVVNDNEEVFADPQKYILSDQGFVFLLTGDKLKKVFLK